MRILCSAVLASMLACSAAMAIDIRNAAQTFGGRSAQAMPLDPDAQSTGDMIPLHLDFVLDDGWPDSVGQAALVIEPRYFWEWWREDSLIAHFGGVESVPTEYQPWLDAAPHEVEFILTDPTGLLEYGSFAFVLTQAEGLETTPRPDDWSEPYESWSRESFGNGTLHLYQGEARVIVDLNATALLDLNTVLAQPTGTWTVRLDAPHYPFWRDSGVAPGRPAVFDLSATLFVAVPEPSGLTIWLMLVGLATAGVSRGRKRKSDREN